jgi:hypothetical protein
MKLVTANGEVDEQTRVRVHQLIAVAESAADIKRRAECAERIRVHDGDAQHLVRRMPAEDATHFASKPKLTPPLLSHSLRQISFVYDIPPHRLSEDDKEWQSKFWSYGGGGFNAALHAALPMAKLCGEVHAWYRAAKNPLDPAGFLQDSESPLPEEPGVSTEIWTSDQVIVLPHVVNQRHAQAVALYAADVPAAHLPQPAMGHVGAVEVWHYLDDTYYGQLWRDKQTKQWRVGTIPNPDGSGTVNLAEHGLEMLPVQSWPWKYDPSQRGYWAKPWAGKDLLPNLSAIYGQLTEYMWTAKLQRGQPVGLGVSSPPLGPDHIVMLDDANSSFEIIANNANLDGMLESVTSSLSLLAKTLGLPSRTFRLQDTAALSGIAIVLDRGELEDQRRGDEQTWSRTETIAHRIVAHIMSVRGLGDLSTDVTTAFTPLAPILTQEQRQAMVTLERQQGTMSKREMKATLHPDLQAHVIDLLLAAAEAESAAGGDVASLALNGAQVTALQGILESVALGTLAPEAARIAIANAFPAIDEDEAMRMVQAAASRSPSDQESDSPSPGAIDNGPGPNSNADTGTGDDAASPGG